MCQSHLQNEQHGGEDRWNVPKKRKTEDTTNGALHATSMKHLHLITHIPTPVSSHESSKHAKKNPTLAEQQPTTHL